MPAHQPLISPDDGTFLRQATMHITRQQHHPARCARHDFNAQRSGDVVIIQEPFKYPSDGFLVATHGAPYSYDTHVLLIIMGGGLAHGCYAQATTLADIAPTFSKQPYACKGRATPWSACSLKQSGKSSIFETRT